MFKMSTSNSKCVTVTEDGFFHAEYKDGDLKQRFSSCGSMFQVPGLGN